MDTSRSYYNVSNPIAKVMEHIENFVIPENRRAIEYLWSMNILTTQTNDYDNKNSWIAIGNLSPENTKIFYDFANRRRIIPEEEGFIGLLGYGNGFSVPIKPGDKDPFDEFKKLFDFFHYQDVQKDGYMTVDEFYIKFTDCYRWVDNPERNVPMPRKKDYEDERDYYRAYGKYLDAQGLVAKIKVFDITKCVKDLRDYLEEAGLADCYDEEEGKIFYCRRLYEGHMRYKEMMQKGKGKGI